MDIDKILKESFELNKKYKKFIKKNKDVEYFKGQMILEYPYLSSNYFAIFNISINASYDFNRLKKMLNLANKVKKNEISEHDASVKVGTILVDEIVKPQLKK